MQTLIYQALVVFWVLIAVVAAVELCQKDHSFRALFWVFGILLMFMFIGTSKAHAETITAHCSNYNYSVNVEVYDLETTAVNGFIELKTKDGRTIYASLTSCILEAK